MTSTPTTATRRTTLLIVGLVVAALVVLVLVVQLTARSATTPDADGRLEIAMEDYRFVPPEVTVPAEEPVTLVFDNHDEVGHHVTFGRDLIVEDGVEVGYEQDLFASAPVQVSPSRARVGPSEGFPNFTILVEPGATVEVITTLPTDTAGTWQLGCFTARGCHYRTGLVGELTVE